MSVVLYNDNESFSAEWMRELTKAGELSAGDISEDCIKSLKAETLKNYKRVHLFAGIGGWEYALKLAEWPKEWPVWTGSCPCQPFSGAGKGKGVEDERHLWPEMFRLIKGCKPPVIFGEQVASPAGIDWMQSVQADLEGAGYEVGKLDLCAAGLGAPHIRQRIFWVAHRIGAGLERLIWDGNRSDKSRRDQEDETGSAAEGCGNGRLDGTYGQCFPTAGNHSSRWPNATQGFWGNSDWLFCRDGKWRPVESASQRMANGLSLCLGSMCKTCVGEKEGALNAEEAIKLGGKALRVLRETDGAEAFWISVGGRIGFPQATFLLAVMCKYSRELGIITDSETSGSEQNGQDFLRALREHASQTSRPSQGSECSEQFTKELGDALSKLSQDSAQHRELMTSLESYTDGPLAHGVSNRVGKLRGYGNAIVPQVAAWFIKQTISWIKGADVEQIGGRE